MISQSHIEVVKKSIQGKSNKEIAMELGVSVRAIQKRKVKLLDDTNSKTIEQAVYKILLNKQ